MALAITPEGLLPVKLSDCCPGLLRTVVHGCLDIWVSFHRVQATIHVSFPSASRMRRSSSLQLTKPLASALIAIAVVGLHVLPSCPLLTHDPLQTNSAPLMYTAPEPWVPQHGIQPAARQQLRLGKQWCAPRFINTPHKLRVRDGVGALHHAVSLDARAAMAEEIDEDALQRLSDVVLVDVHAQVAQLDE